MQVNNTTVNKYSIGTGATIYNKNKLQQTMLDIQKEKGPQPSQRYKASKGGQRRPTVPNDAKRQQQAEETAAVLLQATSTTECDSTNLHHRRGG